MELILDLEPEPRFHIDTQGPIVSKIGRLSFESEIRAMRGSAPNSATKWIPLVVRMLESLASRWQEISKEISRQQSNEPPPVVDATLF